MIFFFLHPEGPSNRKQQQQPVLLLDEAMEDEEQLELYVFWGWNIEFQPGIFFEHKHHNDGSLQSKLQILMHTSMWPFLYVSHLGSIFRPTSAGARSQNQWLLSDQGRTNNGKSGGT